MFKHLLFCLLFSVFCSHLSGQKALLGVELGTVATKPNFTNSNQHFETGLGPSLNLNYTRKFKKAFWINGGITAKSLTYNRTVRVFFPSDINNPDGSVFSQRTRHFAIGTAALAGVQLPGFLKRFSPFVGLGTSFILHSTSRNTKQSGSGSVFNWPHGDYDGAITEFTGGLQYRQPMGKRFFLTTSVRYVYAPAEVVYNSNVFPATYNFSHVAAHISLQRVIRW